MLFEGDDWASWADTRLLSQIELHGRPDWRPDVSTLLSQEFSGSFAGELNERIVGALAIGTPPIFQEAPYDICPLLSVTVDPSECDSSVNVQLVECLASLCALHHELL